MLRLPHRCRLRMLGTEPHICCVCHVLVVQASARRVRSKKNAFFSDELRCAMKALRLSNTQFIQELDAQEYMLEVQLLEHPVSRALKRLGVPLQFAKLNAATRTPQSRSGAFQKSRWVQELALHRELVLKSQLLQLQAGGGEGPAFIDPDLETSSQLLGTLADVDEPEIVSPEVAEVEAVTQPTVPFIDYLILKDKAASNSGKVAELQQQISELQAQLAAAQAVAAAAVPAAALVAAGGSGEQADRRGLGRRRSSCSSSDEDVQRGRRCMRLHSGIKVVMLSD